MQASRPTEALDRIAARPLPAPATPRLAPADAVEPSRHHDADSGPESLRTPPSRRAYLSVRTKYVTALAVSLAWTAFSTVLSLPWLQDLAGLAGWPLAIFIVGGIALMPGMMNAFLVTGLLLDRRPPRRELVDYPSI